MVSSCFITFSVLSITANNLRSEDFVFSNGPRDTDYISVNAVPAVDVPKTATKGPVSFDHGQVFSNEPGTVGPLLLTMGGPIAFNYQITNSGNANTSTVTGALTKAGTALGQKGVSAALTAIESAAGAGAGVAVGTGASLGSVILPIIGSVVGAVAGWLLSEGFSFLFADCDGLVASEQFSEDINQLWLYTNGSGGWQTTTDHQGTPSPSGCGSGLSDYSVTWSISLYWLNNSDNQSVPRPLIRYQNHMDLFWVDANGAIATSWMDGSTNTVNDNSWVAPFPISSPDPFPGLVGSVVTLGRTQPHIDVFWIASDGSIKSVWYDANVNNGAWNAEFQIAPAESAQPESLTAISRTPTHVDLFWVGTKDGTIQTAWWDQGANNAAWNPAFAIAPAGSAPIGYVPAVIARAPNHLDLFWVSGDGSVRSVWWDANINNGAWNPWFNVAPAGSAVQSKISVLSRIPTHMDVFWVAPDGSVRTAWWDQNAIGAAWNSQFNIAPPGSAATAAPVAVVARTPNHIDLFWIGPDGSVRTSFWDATTTNLAWSPPAIIAPAGSSLPQEVAVVVINPQAVYVFWICPNGSVMTAWHNGGGNEVYVPASAVVPKGNVLTTGRPLSAVARMANVIDLFWIAPDHSVRTAFWSHPPYGEPPAGNLDGPFIISPANSVGGVGG